VTARTHRTEAGLITLPLTTCSEADWHTPLQLLVNITMPWEAVHYQSPQLRALHIVPLLKALQYLEPYNTVQNLKELFS